MAYHEPGPTNSRKSSYMRRPLQSCQAAFTVYPSSDWTRKLRSKSSVRRRADPRKKNGARARHTARARSVTIAITMPPNRRPVQVGARASQARLSDGVGAPRPVRVALEGEREVDRPEQLLEVDRLGQAGDRPVGRGVRAEIERVHPGGQHDRHVVLAPDLLRQIDPVHARHAQVRHDEVRQGAW